MPRLRLHHDPSAVGFTHCFGVQELRVPQQAISGIRAADDNPCGQQMVLREMQAIVRNHFEQFTSSPEQAMQALFPMSVPVAQVTIASCTPVSELSHEDRKYGGINSDDYGIKLTDSRIVTQPKPRPAGRRQRPVVQGLGRAATQRTDVERTCIRSESCPQA